jgi:DNA-binding response OmpR family regulator
MIRNRVLIVEEDIDFRKQIKNYLSRDMEVVTAGDVQTGLRHTLTAEPDLVVISLFSRADETDLFYQIKASSGAKDIPIIVLRSDPSISEIENLNRYKIDLILIKPVSVEELEDHICELLKDIFPSPKKLSLYEIQGFE